MAIWLLLQVTIMGRPVSLGVLAALMLTTLISIAGVVVGVIVKRRIDAIAPPLDEDVDEEA